MWKTATAVLALGLLAAPAAAQKRGGTATLGLELDIAGFDQLRGAIRWAR